MTTGLRATAALAIASAMVGGCAAQPEAKPTAAAVKACAVADLEAKAAWQSTGAAGGHVSWVVLIRNAGKETCAYDGSAEVFATDPASKEHRKLKIRRGTFFDGEWQVSPATIKPGEPMALTISSGTGCNGGIGLKTYTEVEVGVGDRRWKLDGLQVVADDQQCLLSVSKWFTRADGKAWDKA